jgi:release factor glutamine methyltransferase
MPRRCSMRREERWPIYPPREDTYLLLPFARAASNETVVEVGAGNGLLALTAARQGAKVLATDRNPNALRELRARARGEGVSLETVRTDLMAGLGRFDRILANPPYLPTAPGSAEANEGDRLALDGGVDGLRVTRRLFRSWADHLTPKGRAYVVVSTLQDPAGLAQILDAWRAEGGAVTSVATWALEGERLEVLECRWRDEGDGRRGGLRD